MLDEPSHTCPTCGTPLERPGLPQYGNWWCPNCKAHWMFSRQEMTPPEPTPQEEP